jgi:hypothetical protein
MLAVALVAAPRPALATCGGGGGGGGGGGHGGGGGGGVSSRCDEISSVVGHQRCHHFGAWDASQRRLSLSVGASALSLPMTPMVFAGVAQHTDAMMKYTLPGASLGDDTLVLGMLDLRGTYLLAPWSYIGLEGSFGYGSLGGASAGVPLGTPGLMAQPTGVWAFSGGAALGLRAPLGPIAVRPEVLVGARVLDVGGQTTYAACTASLTAETTQAIVSPRVFLDVTVWPGVDLGAVAGANLLDAGERFAGLYLSLHAP